MNLDCPLFLPISNTKQENPHVKTFYFDYPLNSRPGQFVMVWIPGVDLKPFSVSYDNGRQFGGSVFPVGPMSKRFCSLDVGDRVGITGPYGTAFTVSKKYHYILIGGGYGAGPLATLAEEVASLGGTIDICLGAKTQELLLFTDRIGNMPNITVHVATDDGSRGHHGYVTDVLRRILHENIKALKHENILVSTCGPELMEKRVLDICNEYEVNCEISIERYMKCGFGVCGQCCMDPIGIRTCMEGQVVSRDVANQLTEFGKYHRDKSGTKMYY
ncbi:MAG: dihydroorotate dehydrogenase electron transfer subunit [Patescibacteria group bacterium]